MSLGITEGEKLLRTIQVGLVAAIDDLLQMELPCKAEFRVGARVGGKGRI